MAEIERYRQDDRHTQADLLRRLNDVLDRVPEAAGVALNRTSRQDHGDGRQLIVLPAGLSEATIVPMLIRGLLAGLDHDGRHSRLGRLRLRVSIAHDAVTLAGHRYAGRAVVMAARLLDSPAGPEELQAQPAALFALLVPDDLYQDLFGQDPGAWVAGGFHRITVDLPDQNWRGQAWVSAWEPGSLKPPPNRIVKKVRDAVRPFADALPQVLLDMGGPESGSDLEQMEHPAETDHPGQMDYSGQTEHQAPATHESLVEVAEYAVDDHAYTEYEPGYDYGAEYTNDAEYVTDYAASASEDAPPDEVQ
jgi:hypothetical protein